MLTLKKGKFLIINKKLYENLRKKVKKIKKYKNKK